MEQTIGKRIMQNRKRMGLTQDQLAEQLGVTAQAVSKWENDQSCPDISMLGTLADIFQISTDALLGREEAIPVHETEVVEDLTEENDEKSRGWEFHYDSGKRGSLSIAILVLAIGVQLLIGKIFSLDLSFGAVLWPSALIVFGLYGLMQKFSFFRIGCLLFGGYFLLDTYDLLPFTLGSELVFPTVLVLFGLSLLVDAMKKPAKPTFHFRSKNGKHKNDFSVDGDTLEYSASFGEHTQDVIMEKLSRGRLSTSFGDYTVDLTGVRSVSENCSLQANCSFGELTLIVPRCFAVKQSNSTAFGEISVCGHADPEPQGVIYLKTQASFAEINIRYV